MRLPPSVAIILGVATATAAASATGERDSPMPNLGCVRGRFGLSFSLLEQESAAGKIFDVRSSPGKTVDTIVWAMLAS